ncbi:hypothetical protein [Subtercola sp. YIM 133946]|uniref:hypothetical protein n=1 Tax=Subtercola sp. YIM 133946 TaxID=3118909 RepID=UPI002F94DA18
MTDTNKPVIHRAERTLTFMIATIIGLSILCMLAAFVSGIAHFTLVPVILVFPLFGLPIGVLLILALLITNAVRRTREARSTE